MACGCFVVGYDGLGGRELFDIAHDFNMSKSIPVGDWNGFMIMLKMSQSVFPVILRIFPLIYFRCLLVLRLYSYDSMQSSVELALGRL